MIYTCSWKVESFEDLIFKILSLSIFLLFVDSIGIFLIKKLIFYRFVFFMCQLSASKFLTVIFNFNHLKPRYNIYRNNIRSIFAPSCIIYWGLVLIRGAVWLLSQLYRWSSSRFNISVAVAVLPSLRMRENALLDI